MMERLNFKGGKKKPLNIPVALSNPWDGGKNTQGLQKQRLTEKPKLTEHQQYLVSLVHFINITGTYIVLSLH